MVGPIPDQCVLLEVKNAMKYKKYCLLTVPRSLCKKELDKWILLIQMQIWLAVLFVCLFVCLFACYFLVCVGICFMCTLKVPSNISMYIL